MRRRRYTLEAAAAWAARLADRAAWYSGGAAERARLAVRTALARTGVPVTREFLELGCARGNEASGLFSEFTAVLGCIHHYEQHRDIYSGLAVDFGVDGLYYDAGRGRNWWEYYFAPIRLGSADHARVRTVPLWQHDAFAEGVEATLSRETAAGLVRSQIVLQPEIQQAVDDFIARRFVGAPVLGVHYRDTDKHEESAPVAIAQMIDAIRAALGRHAGAPNIFVATDDAHALDAISSAFPGRVLSADAERSRDGEPVHKRPGDAYRKGFEACVDCGVLARCAQLVRTSSNLGLVATYFNPAMPVTLVSAQR
ncbi:MAG: hypothetical protein RLZZ53_624 [Acidobacteriota bacterium]|jgi:hypothetical protein